mgnify:CR=1 FL=1
MSLGRMGFLLPSLLAGVALCSSSVVDAKKKKKKEDSEKSEEKKDSGSSEQSAEREIGDDSKVPFYASDSEADALAGESNVYGSITSSSLYYKETGKPVPIGDAGLAVTNTSSPVARVFTEMRMKLQADHISGGEWDFKGDLRFRKQIDACRDRVVAGAVVSGDCLPSQSGTFGGEERDARELYLRYRSEGYDLTLGRQFMPEVAAIKFDGARFEQHAAGSQWRYFGFGGVYPTRGSRDYRSDYPQVFNDPMDPMAKTRLVPVVAGGGASYRKERLYGSVGGAAILPRGNELATNLPENTRILVTSNGYWQQSDKTDVHHYAVLDVAGSAGTALTNLSLGVNHRPSDGVGLFAQVNRVDTETLTVHAQERLDAVDAAAATSIQNNWYVSRVAQESLRAGVSSSFSQNRFQLTVTGGLRRRPEIALMDNGGNEVLLPLAQATEVTLNFIDRYSVEGFRIGGTVTRTFGSKEENLDRSKSNFAKLDASRELKGGKGEFELNLSYLNSVDDTRNEVCLTGDFLSCYGTAASTIYGLGGVVFYRPKKNWFVMAMASVGQQSLETVDAAGIPEKQPALRMYTGFARLAYRF